MKRLISLLIALALVLPLTVSAETLFQQDTGAKQPLIQNSYACNSNAETLDPLCELKAAWSFSQYGWGGIPGEVIDSSGQSGSTRENRALNSEDMTQGTWSGPANVLTALTVQDNSAAATQQVQSDSAGVPGNLPWTAYADVLKVGSPTFYPSLAIVEVGGTNARAAVIIDTANGTLTDKVTGGAWTAPDSSSIATSPEDPNYWRVSVTKTMNADNTGIRNNFYPAANTDASGVWAVTAMGTTTATRFQLTNTDGPVAYIATTGTAITIFYNHGRAINGLVPTVADGKLWRGADFDGTDQYIDVTSTPLTSLMGFSLSAWAEFTGGAQRNPVFGFRNNALAGFFADWNVDNKPRLVLGATNLRVWTPTGVTLNDGEFHHYLLCSPGTGAQTDANNAVLYIDGVLQAISSTTTTSVQTPRLNAFIGRIDNEYYTGKLDEPYLWSVNQCEDDRMAKWLYNGGRGRYIQ